MPYQNFNDGLYLIKQPSNKGGIEHYGVLDVGNTIRHPQVSGLHPIVIHQIPPRARMSWFKDTGTWNVIGKVDLKFQNQAIERIKVALKTPDYDLFSNNCEQFARFITEGEKYSTQLRWAGGIALILVAITIFDWN